MNQHTPNQYSPKNQPSRQPMQPRQPRRSKPPKQQGKLNTAVKAALFSVLGILLLSGIFIGVNRLVFATATGREIPLDTAEPTPPVIDRFEAVPEGFPFPEFYLSSHHPDGGFGPGALTAEEAALVGAKYIWEMFGADISGTTMHINIGSFPSSTRSQWEGSVGVSGVTPHPDWYMTWLFSFAIDAINGERLHINDHNKRGDGEAIDASVVGLSHEQLVETFTVIAQAYAQRHFNFSEIASVSYEGTRGMSDYRIYIEDAPPNFIITGEPCCHVWSGETLLHFTAIDDTGRSARLAISMETRRLTSLTTQHNDIIPGWEANPHGGRYPMTEYGPWLSLYLGPHQRITAIQLLEPTDQHLFYEEIMPTLTLPIINEPPTQQYISMDFSGDLFPLNVTITRRRTDLIGHHHFSTQWAYLVAPGGWTPGLYEYKIPITDDGFDHFYFVRTTWPDGISTNVFRVNSSDRALQTEHSIADNEGDDYPQPSGEPEARDIAWVIEPTLDYMLIWNCSCGRFFASSGRGLGLEIDTHTGQTTEPGAHGHGSIGPPIVFDRQRQLIGHPGIGGGYHYLMGMHSIDEFSRLLTNYWADVYDGAEGLDFGSWRNPLDGPIVIESVDSYMRNYWEMEYMDINNELSTISYWTLYPEAFLGNFALMYNRQFTTDFIFDGVNNHYADWQVVTDSGIIAVSKNGEWGLVDRLGNTLIDFMFDNLVIIDENTAFARLHDKYGILNIPQTVEALRP